MGRWESIRKPTKVDPRSTQTPPDCGGNLAGSASKGVNYLSRAHLRFAVLNVWHGQSRHRGAAVIQDREADVQDAFHHIACALLIARFAYAFQMNIQIAGRFLASRLRP